MTQADTRETGQSGHARREAGPGIWRARLRRAIRGGFRRRPWKRGRVLAVLALLLGLVMLLQAGIPNQRWNLGSLVESILPWFGLFIPVLLSAALLRRSAVAVVALLVPALVWLNLFGGVLTDKSRQGAIIGYSLTAVSENVNAGNPDPAATARDLASSGADVLALVELTTQDAATYEKGLSKAYPYHAVVGTVGLWSKLPLSGVRPINIVDYGPLAATKPAGAELPSNRALRATVATVKGPLAVYVAHLGSVRVNPREGFWVGHRNIDAETIASAIAADPDKRVMLLGDLNGSTSDRALGSLTSRLRSAQDVAGAGFGFTYPASFPMVRIDQILVRGMSPDSSWVLPANGSDHLPVAARISW